MRGNNGEPNQLKDSKIKSLLFKFLLKQIRTAFDILSKYCAINSIPTVLDFIWDPNHPSTTKAIK